LHGKKNLKIGQFYGFLWLKGIVNGIVIFRFSLQPNSFF